MQAMRNAIQIANYFIWKGLQEGDPVSPMKLQKLLFYAYGWFRVLKNDVLFNESIQAWKYGPVITTVYHSTKQWGSNGIQEFITSPSDDFPVFLDENNDAAIIEFLNIIWGAYSKYSAMQLSNATHAPNSPWTKVVESYPSGIPSNTSIPDDYIRTYFEQLKTA
jgi:uncharacterized phage-associated protein